MVRCWVHIPETSNACPGSIPGPAIKQKLGVIMVTPLGNKVLIKQKEIKEISEGGIYLALNAQDKPSEGTVASVGPLVTQVTTGDVVMYGKYAGTEIKHNEEEYLLVKEEDLIAIITDIK